MRVTRKDPPDKVLEMLARQQLAYDRSGMLQAASDQGLTIGINGEVYETPFPSGAVDMKPEYMLGAALGGRAVMPMVDNAALAVSSALKPVGAALTQTSGELRG